MAHRTTGRSRVPVGELVGSLSIEQLREVVSLLSRGFTNEEIGGRFGRSRGWASLKRQELAESYREFFEERTR